MSGALTSSADARRVAYVVRSWPRLSQTFIANEVAGLEELGLELTVFSMTHANEPLAAQQVATVRAPIRYLDAARRRSIRWRAGEHLRVLRTAPGRYLSTLAFTARGRHLTDGYTTTRRAVCFAHAVHVATVAQEEASEGRPISRLHAHFAHDPALVALLAHGLTGIPFSLTAHARDLFAVEPLALEARVREATAVVTCCRANVEYLRAVAGDGRLHLVHHGVDIERFRPGQAALHLNSNGDTALPLVLSVGRLVEKKGFADLLRACAVLKEHGHRFRCEIYGDGPMAEELALLRDELGLQDTVTLRGARAHSELVPLFQSADVFVLTPFIGADGDRDGLPNVLVEAMACGVPVVATAVGGVHDLLRDGENGLMAAPHDPEAVAEQVGALLADPGRRRTLGAAARRTVEDSFDARAAARQLAALFGAGERAAV